MGLCSNNNSPRKYTQNHLLSIKKEMEFEYKPINLEELDTSKRSKYNNQNNQGFSSIIQEKGFGHKPIRIDLLNKLKKSICKIQFKINGIDNFGTGFFMLYNNNKFLLTCYHVINSKESDINIEFWNKNKNKLDLINRNIIFLQDPIDITIIEINESDLFIKDIEFLFNDSNYDIGYQHYKGVDIINIGYPKGGEISAASGRIDEVKNIDFFHKIDTEPGSSGSPIILYYNSYVIGIHKGVDKNKNLNIGAFIGEVINNLKRNNENNIKNNYFHNTKNEIIAIYNKQEDKIDLLCNYNNENRYSLNQSKI